MQIRLKGHPAETACFDSLTDAKRWAADTETAIREGKHFGIAHRRTFTALADKCEAAIADHVKSVQARTGHLAHWRCDLDAHSLETSAETIDTHRMVTPKAIAAC